MSASLEQLLARLEALLEDLDATEEPIRSQVYELLDGVDALHRSAIRALVDALGDEAVRGLADTHPAISWLFMAYAPDDRVLADLALDDVRPFIHGHGGAVEVLDVTDGVVHVRLDGACRGCSASAATLRHGVEEALRTHLPGFRRLDVDEDDAPVHPPPGEPLSPAGRVLPVVPG